MIILYSVNLVFTVHQYLRRYNIEHIANIENVKNKPNPKTDTSIKVKASAMQHRYIKRNTLLNTLYTYKIEEYSILLYFRCISYMLLNFHQCSLRKQQL